MNEKLVIVARFSDAIEATLAQQLLGNSQIKSILTGENTANAYSGLGAIAPVELQVFESQAEQARQILQSREPQED